MTRAKTRSASRDNLSKAHDAVRLKGQSTRELLYSVLRDSDQPLTVSEVRTLAAERGRPFDRAHVAKLLRDAVDSGLVHTRLETDAEREIRVSGRDETARYRGSHFQTHYFWIGSARGPKRTAAEIKQTAATDRKVRKARKVRRPARVATVQTGSSSGTDAMAILVARIVELENQLAKIREAAR